MKAIIVYVVLMIGMVWNVSAQADVLTDAVTTACKEEMKLENIQYVIEELQSKGLNVKIEQSYNLLYLYCIKEQYNNIYNNYIEYIIEINSI